MKRTKEPGSSQKFLSLLLFAVIVLAVPLTYCIRDFPGRYNYVPYIEDVPLPLGFRINQSLTTSYDTPGGRIVDVYAEGTSRLKDVISFYAEALPPLGWNIDTSDNYIKNKEKLTITTEEKDHRIHIHFTLRPI